MVTGMVLIIVAIGFGKLMARLEAREGSKLFIFGSLILSLLFLVTGAGVLGAKVYMQKWGIFVTFGILVGIIIILNSYSSQVKREKLLYEMERERDIN